MSWLLRILGGGARVCGFLNTVIEDVSLFLPESVGVSTPRSSNISRAFPALGGGCAFFGAASSFQK